MKKIEIYTWSWCPYCIAAKSLLKKKNQTYTEYDATEDTVAAEMRERAGRTSVPQIFIDGQHIGGYDDIKALDAAGELDGLLNSHVENRFAS